MKSTRKYLTLITLLAVGGLQAQSAWVASFKASRPLNGTTIGYTIGPVLLYGGLDMMRLSIKDESSSTNESWDWNNGRRYLSWKSESTVDLNGTLLIPHAGLRYYFKKGATQAYVMGEGFIILPFLNYSYQSSSTSYNPNGSVNYTDSYDESWNDEDKKEAADALDFLGLVAGFGAEHNLGEGFSIGSEFGLRLFMNSWDNVDDYTSNDGYYKDTYKSSVNISLAGTFTSLSLNYRF